MCIGPNITLKNRWTVWPPAHFLNYVIGNILHASMSGNTESERMAF